MKKDWRFLILAFDHELKSLLQWTTVEQLPEGEIGCTGNRG
jgi:hypothetical protein